MPLTGLEKQEFFTMISNDKELGKVKEYVFSWQRDAAEEALKKGEKLGVKKGVKKGVKQGVKQGEKTGLLKGERLGLQRLLEIKFGPLAEDTLNQLEAADHKVLEIWYERILTASTLEAIFEPAS
jgi:hypothetical protein